MRYLLVVGFHCDMYRREPRARIFVEDRLVDEFSIPHMTSNLFTAIEQFNKKLHPLQPFSNKDWDNLNKKNYPPLKFYELEVNDEISNLSICINIDNHDSNYSNGYMTRSTLLKLEVCAFFPLEQRLLRRLEKIKDKRRISENYAWYALVKNRVFELARNGMCWNGVNGQKKIANISYHPHNVGGDGAYVCQLTKKYGIFMPTLPRACRHAFNTVILNYLIDKYQQYANQRNNN